MALLNNEMLVTDLTTLDQHEVLRISDGTPPPPKHHTKKYWRWQNKNRVCLVHRYEPQYKLLGVKDKVDSCLVDNLSTVGLNVYKLSDPASVNAELVYSN